MGMWNSYSSNSESVAIRTSRSKLEKVIDSNRQFLDDKGLVSYIDKLKYVPNIQALDDNKRDEIVHFALDVLHPHVKAFIVKPAEYEYENELRVILYPEAYLDLEKRNEVPGIKLPIGTNGDLEELIDAVYIHPSNDKSSFFYKVIVDLHKKYKVSSVQVITSKLVAFKSE
jgi:hypothetical protein